MLKMHWELSLSFIYFFSNFILPELHQFLLLPYSYRLQQKSHLQRSVTCTYQIRPLHLSAASVPGYSWQHQHFLSKAFHFQEAWSEGSFPLQIFLKVQNLSSGRSPVKSCLQITMKRITLTHMDVWCYSEQEMILNRRNSAVLTAQVMPEYRNPQNYY